MSSNGEEILTEIENDNPSEEEIESWKEDIGENWNDENSLKINPENELPAIVAINFVSLEARIDTTLGEKWILENCFIVK